METVIGVIVGLFILVLLVVLHELGHAIVARRNGVVVEEFGIGFPPKAWSKKLKNGIEFSLNWLPLGGFVRMKGEHDSANEKGTYGAASFWQKTKILLAGVLINWLTAALIFSGLALVGMPKLLENQVVLPFDSQVSTKPIRIASVVDGAPADQAGLEQGAEIIAINDIPLTERQTFIDEVVSAGVGGEVKLTYLMPGQTQSQTTNLTVAENPENDLPYAGVLLQPQREYIQSTWSAPLAGFATAGQLTLETFKGVGVLFYNAVTGAVGKLIPSDSVRQEADTKLEQVSQSVAGPVGILGTLFPSVRQAGLVELLAFTGLISLTLAVMNVLPIPALDGGRWFTMAAFRALKKPLTKEREETIQGIGFLLLLGLIVLVTINDIGRFF